MNKIKLTPKQKYFGGYLQVGMEVKTNYYYREYNSWYNKENTYEDLKGIILSVTKDGSVVVEWEHKGIAIMDSDHIQRYSKWAFDNETVKEIRKLYSTGDYTQKGLAEIYDCSTSTIYKVLHKYEHVKKD